MKNKNGLPIFKIAVVVVFLCAAIALILVKNNFEKSPEYSIYQTILAVKNKDYQTFSSYVDTKEVTVKIVEDIKQEILKKPEIAKLPNQEIISEMLNEIADEQETKIQEDFKNDIKSGKYAKELESIPDYLIYVGLIIKKYDKYEIAVKNNSYISTVDVNIDGQSKGKFTLENRKNKWIIVNIESEYISSQLEKMFPKLDTSYIFLNQAKLAGF